MEFENATISDDFLTNPQNPYQKQKVSGKMSLLKTRQETVQEGLCVCRG